MLNAKAASKNSRPFIASRETDFVDINQILVASFHMLSGICLGSRSATCCLRTQNIVSEQVQQCKEAFFFFAIFDLLQTGCLKLVHCPQFNFRKRYVLCYFSNTGKDVDTMKFLLKKVCNRYITH